MKEVKHVFFDLDRTLWDFESNSEATLKELFSDFKLSEKLGISDTEFIYEYKRINEIFWEDYRNGTIEKQHLRYGRFETALKYFGRDDKQMASEIGELYISQSPRKTGLIDGSLDVLEYLNPNYKLHIITNGFEEVQHIKMQSSGLSPFFQHIITSESAGAKKPSGVIFDFAERLTGATAQNSVMIGDHFEADIIGAMESRWKAVFFEPEKPKMKNEPFIHIHHLKELMDIL
ncbi:MAG: YjjG family noncanonical pyrimidine nucleotidase [Flavobacteriales bacterium]|nr:YjjG family noncanonical pyrimidine nucleotidase [Flavobacteriales bacterium]